MKPRSLSFLVALVFVFGVVSLGWSADDKWTKENRWDKWGRTDQVGTLNDVTPQMILKAISLIKAGKVYDLETLRFKGMPVWPGHSGWDVLPYGSPKGRQNMQAFSVYDPKYNWYAKGGWLDASVNKYNVGLNSEILVGPLHVGSHIDSFSHLTVGEDNHWWNGFTEAKYWSNYGPLMADASNIPPIILRGVLLDIPGYKKVAALAPGYGVTVEDIKGCAKWEGVEIKAGDALLIRTGQTWPVMSEAGGAGPTLDAVKYLIGEKNVFVIGDDQAAFENFPPGQLSSFPEHVHPVHHYMLIQNGVHIMEMVMTNELAKDKVYEFCFMTLPNKIKGATGSMIRPIAVI
jgi:kynurenine formamidase